MIRFLEWVIELISGIRIALSPSFIGCAIGGIVYIKFPTFLGLVIAYTIGLAGIITGILWAIRIHKTQGTSWFMSRINASPDLDQLDSPGKNEKEKKSGETTDKSEPD